MPSYCNWHRGTVRMSETGVVERTCHSDKTHFILVAKTDATDEVRIPAEDAVALRDNLNDFIRLSEGYPAARVLEFEGENAKLRNQVADLKHRLQTMRGVLDKAIKALE